MRKPILCLDFDGVLHSYSSGWKGAANIPDPPVPGALEFVVTSLDHFRVAIFSSRTHQWGGRAAMKAWLRHHLLTLDDPMPQWWHDRIMRSVTMDPWSEEVCQAIRLVIRQIEWPLFKPSAMVTIDDRALTFTGEWPKVEALRSFKPWNKQ